MSEDRIHALHQKARALTVDPGVYLMRNKAGGILYIGKAKNLKNRVSSYFRALDKHLPKVLAMVLQVQDFETIVTASEFEALVLECSLIKQHTPKYNILLKDDKGYSYLRIDKGVYPRIMAVKQKADSAETYIGPYMSAWVVKNTADEVNKAFGLPTCARQFPRDIKKGRPCLNYHLKQCMGVCRGGVSPEDYAEIIRQAIEYIQGGSVQAQKLLTEQMERAAENLEFEKAAKCRDRLQAIARFSDRQRVVYANVADQDVLAFVQSGGDLSLSLIKFRGQRLVDKLDFLFPDISSVEDAREEFISRYYSDPLHELPSQLTVDGPLPDQPLVEQLLSRRLGKKVTIVQPQRGNMVKLVEMARLNAAEQLSLRSSGRTGRELAALDELAKLLGLSKPPTWIESYDISNIGSETIVGSMVVFENGRPQKAAYKHFSIKDITGPDDYASMAQMLNRRFARYLAQAEDGGFFNRLPDLLLIDGGRGHVTTAKGVLASLALEIPVFGMVKDDRHRTRAISSQGGEIGIASHRSVFTLVTTIQDETHRFAINYARKAHKKTAFELSITKVKNIGQVRARALFAHFKTKKAILEADEQALAAVKGMNLRAARSLLEAVRKGEIG
ncbi:MAG: excinuclease ABC subunit UvrC [Candidatus Fimivivens sp.]